MEKKSCLKERMNRMCQKRKRYNEFALVIAVLTGLNVSKLWDLGNEGEGNTI